MVSTKKFVLQNIEDIPPEDSRDIIRKIKNSIQTIRRILDQKTLISKSNGGTTA